LSDLHDWLASRQIEVTTSRKFALRSASRTKRPCVVYPTPLGVDRIRFTDDEHPKYRWARAGGHPHWYGLTEALEHDGPIYVVNGEPSVWAAWQYSVSAVCTLGGESGVPSDIDLIRLANFGRDIRIVFDNDDAGRKGAQNLANAFACNDIAVEIRDIKEAVEQLSLEHDVPRKGFDVDDLSRIVKGELAQWLTDLAITPVIVDETKPVPRDSAQWTIAETVLQRLKPRNGPDLVFSGDQFWRYAGRLGIWEPVDGDIFDSETGSLNGLQVGFSDPPKYIKVNASTLAGVKACAQVVAGQKDYFDDAPAGIAFFNGFLSTQTWNLEPHAPEHRAQFSARCNWEPDASAPMLEKMLAVYTHQMTDDESRLHLMLYQEVLGCVAAGINGYSYWLTGYGDNGKSTLLDLAAELVDKKLRTSISPKLLSDPNVSQYYVAQLYGKRLNIDADIPESDILDSSEWKKSVTGDYITGRNPAGQPFQFRPSIIHLFSANALPNTRDHSDGFWRRSVVIPMTMPIPSEMKIEGIAKRIATEERAGLFAWAVAGARRFLGNKKAHSLPQASLDEKATWKRDADQVAVFAELWEPDDYGAGIRAAELHGKYQEWARKSGFGQLSITKFGRRMGQMFDRKSTAYGTCYQIRKRQGADAPF